MSAGLAALHAATSGRLLAAGPDSCGCLGPSCVLLTSPHDGGRTLPVRTLCCMGGQWYKSCHLLGRPRLVTPFSLRRGAALRHGLLRSQGLYLVTDYPADLSPSSGVTRHDVPMDCGLGKRPRKVHLESGGGSRGVPRSNEKGKGRLGEVEPTSNAPWSDRHLNTAVTAIKVLALCNRPVRGQFCDLTPQCP